MRKKLILLALLLVATMTMTTAPAQGEEWCGECTHYSDGSMICIIQPCG